MTISQSTISEAEANALSNTVDGGTGAKFLLKGGDENDTPAHWTMLAQRDFQLMQLLGRIAGGAVLDKGGLDVLVKGCTYVIGGTRYTLPDDDSFACTDDATNYLYVDADEVVKTNTTAWPADVLRLAKVVCAGGDIASVESALHENAVIGGTSLWYGVPAAGVVDMAGYDTGDPGFHRWSDSELTIAAGVITPTCEMHQVGGEGGVDDDLTDITAVAGQRRLLLLRAGGAETITIKSTGNIDITKDYLGAPVEFAMDNTSQGAILLQQISDTTWQERWRHPPLMGGSLSDAIVGNDHGIYSLEGIAFKEVDETIAAGLVTLDEDEPVTRVIVDTEASAATDDLDSMGPAYSGQMAIISPKNDARTVVVKHGAGVLEFSLQNGLDFTMDSTKHMLICAYDSAADMWVELSRSPMIAGDIVADPGSGGTDRYGRAIPYALGPFFIGGTITVKGYVEIEAPWPFTLVKAAGRLTGTAPSGGALIFDIKKNGLSIFSNDGERIAIADGTTDDTSATKNTSFAAGDIMLILCSEVNGTPSDATITIVANIAPQTPP